MKKLRILALIAASCLLAGAVAVLAGCDRDELTESDGKSTTLSTGKAPEELDAASVAYAFLYREQELAGYTVTTEGTTTVQSVVNVSKQFSSTAVKTAEGYYYEESSLSPLYKSYLQAFLKGDKAAYRGASYGDIDTASRSDFRDAVGVLPDECTLGGYIVNASTLRSAERTGEADGTYTYRYVLNGEKAGGMVKTQIARLDGLDGVPVFKSVRILLVLKKDWTPVKVSVEAEYTLDYPLFGSLTCSYSAVSVYSDIGSASDTLLTNQWSAALEAESKEVALPAAQKTLLAEMAESFAGLDYEAGVTFSGGFSSELLESRGLLGGALTAEATVKTDPSQWSGNGYLGAFDCLTLSAEADYTALKSLCSVLGANTPEVLTYLSQYPVADLYYAGGTLCAALRDGEGNAAAVKSAGALELLMTALSKLGDIDLGGAESESSIMLAAVDDCFTVEETETGERLTLLAPLVRDLSQEYGEIVDGLADSFGSKILANTYLGAEITSLTVTIDYKDGVFSSLTVEISGVPAYKTAEQSLFRLDLTASAMEEGALDGVAEEIEKLISEAEETQEQN